MPCRGLFFVVPILNWPLFLPLFFQLKLSSLHYVCIPIHVYGRFIMIFSITCTIVLGASTCYSVKTLFLFRPCRADTDADGNLWTGSTNSTTKDRLNRDSNSQWLEQHLEDIERTMDPFSNLSVAAMTKSTSPPNSTTTTTAAVTAATVTTTTTPKSTLPEDADTIEAEVVQQEQLLANQLNERYVLRDIFLSSKLNITQAIF